MDTLLVLALSWRKTYSSAPTNAPRLKTLGAFVGTDEYVLRQLKNKMNRIHELTDALIQRPKVQFRNCLHRFCYDAKVDYWLRVQLSHHGRRFVDDIRKQQMRLVASRHGVYEMTEFEDRRSDVHDWLLTYMKLWPCHVFYNIKRCKNIAEALITLDSIVFQHFVP